MWHYWNLGVRCTVALVFLVSTASKLSGRSAFAEFVAATRTVGDLPGRYARPVAAAVVAVEAATAVLTALPATSAAGLCLAASVLVGFALAVGRTVRRGGAASCRCFGPSPGPLGVTQIVRNVVLAGAALGGLSAGAPVAPVPAGVALALGAGALAAIVVVRFDDVVDLFVIR